MLRALASERFVLDGELVIEIDGRLAFDALQMRLHPSASCIRKLSTETPARLSSSTCWRHRMARSSSTAPSSNAVACWKSSWLKRGFQRSLSSLLPRPICPRQKLGCAMRATAQRMAWSRRS